MREYDALKKRWIDSIDKFYLPLQNLLTVYDGEMCYAIKYEIMNEINCHKSLAGYGVRDLFEIYKENDKSTYHKNKLLEKIDADIDTLQEMLRNYLDP